MNLSQALREPQLEEPAWMPAVRQALASAPDPEQARLLAAEVLEVADPTELGAAAPEKLGSVLRALCGIAPFFAPYLRRRPDWLHALLRDDLRIPRTPQDYARLAAPLAVDAAAESLRLLKYYELARITVRDCDEALVSLAQVGDTLRELSGLANALLARALEMAQSDMSRRFGPPCWPSDTGPDQKLAFAVLGLGKLGGEELNYSSDVDLIYVFEAPARPVSAAAGEGYATLTPMEYFTRLAQELGKVVMHTSGEGFLYRIDLDLRPEGRQGTLVVSDQALASYYEKWADTWEKAAFTKARPVAGDLAFGWKAIHALDPLIYRSSMDYTAVAGIRHLKEKIEAAHGNRAEGYNVKLDEGGIRDIELIAQALQLLHGGRIAQVRSRSTQDAIERLRDVRVLEASDAASLLAAYRFLRRLENRLQMEAERQTHLLSHEDSARERVARSLGYGGPDARLRFTRDLEQHRETVRRLFGGLFLDGGSSHVFALLASRLPQLLATESSRTLLEQLAERFAAAIDASPHPERALNNLDRFVHAVGGRRFYFELLIDRPELVGRLSALFASSSYLSSILASHPTLIEPVFHDPSVLLLSGDQLEADFDAILTECKAREEDENVAQLDALRLFFHRQIMNAGLLDLGGKVTRRELEGALTDIAEVCLGRALGESRRWLSLHRQELVACASQTRFIVVGMGKLGSRELTYGSDLDLIFIFDLAGEEARDLAEAQEYATRLGQRLISMLSQSTSEGFCYEVDARLRPSGNQGMLVSSLAAFERYHAASAQVWERMALLRARPVSGDSELGERFTRLRERILRRPLEPGASAEVLHVRGRMERELAKESSRRHDFKRGRGGLLDVENIAQYLQLSHGHEYPALLAPDPIEVQLARLASLGLLAPQSAGVLLEGWELLSRLGTRLRVVENRSISDLDEERGDLEGLAKSLGYSGHGREGSAKRALLSDYSRHTEAIRAVYEQVLGRSAS